MFNDKNAFNTTQWLCILKCFLSLNSEKLPKRLPINCDFISIPSCLSLISVIEYKLESLSEQISLQKKDSFSSKEAKLAMERLALTIRDTLSTQMKEPWSIWPKEHRWPSGSTVIYYQVKENTDFVELKISQNTLILSVLNIILIEPIKQISNMDLELFSSL